MSSLIDYIFVKSLDKCVVIIINLMSSSRISIEFMMRNVILALDDLSYHRPLYCLPSITNMIMFCAIPCVPCYPAFVLLYLGILPSFMSSMLWEFHHLLWIIDASDASHHHHSFHGPRVPTGIPTNGLWCEKFQTSSNPIACKLMNDRYILCVLDIESPFYHWSCYLSP